MEGVTTNATTPSLAAPSSDEMFQRANLITKLIASSVRISEKAGQIIRTILHEGNLRTIEKTGKFDLQTEADRAAQLCIIASLRKRFGEDLTVIGEEDYDSTHLSTIASDQLELGFADDILRLDAPSSYDRVAKNDVVVWVDPLDGTSEFVEYAKNHDKKELLEHVTVLIGVAVKGVAVAGVIHQPYFYHRRDNTDKAELSSNGRTIYGIVGLGAFGIQPEIPVENELVIVTTRSHSDRLVQTAIDALQPTSVLKVGGAGHKVLLVIEGRAHAYVFASGGCKKWDTCAPEAILSSLGGHLTDLSGKAYDYSALTKKANLGGVLATLSSVDHASFVKRIPSEVKSSLDFSG